MAFKVVISDPKTKKAYKKEVDEAASGLLGKKIGEKLSADSFGLSGYEIEVRGGSDKEGFPMRADVEGQGRKKALLSSGPGFKPKMKGQRKRKSVRGNTISRDISQVNLKIVKHGPKTVEELFGIKEEKKEKPAEEKKPEKEAPKVPKPPAEEKNEKPAEPKADKKPEAEKQ